MRADRAELVVVERPDLRQHPLGDRQLADVVKQSAETQGLDALGRPAEGAGDRDGKRGDPGRMTQHVRVAGLDRSGRQARRTSFTPYLQIP